MGRHRKAPAVNLSIRTPLKIVDQLDALADQQGLTRAAIIRKAIERELQQAV